MPFQAVIFQQRWKNPIYISIVCCTINQPQHVEDKAKVHESQITPELLPKSSQS